MPILPPMCAYIVILLLASALYLLGTRIPRQGRVWAFLLGLALSLPALIYTMYYLNLYDDAAWLLRLRSLPLAEYYAAGLGLPIGILAKWLPESRWAVRIKHTSLPLIMMLWLAVPFAKPLLLPIALVQMHDQWQDGVCIQSTASTCGPASAATLLTAQGLHITEAQLARLSWSSFTGTENWYLARALRSLDCHVRYIRTAPNPDRFPYPAIAGTRLGRYGAGHFIAILGKEGDCYIIGDPLTGRSTVSIYNHPSYYFTGMFMVVQRM
jgi:hypothetical protein